MRSRASAYALYVLAKGGRGDLARLNAAAEGLTGEHDFAAYCRRKELATTIRHVTGLAWHREPDGILVATVAAELEQAGEPPAPLQSTCGVHRHVSRRRQAHGDACILQLGA